MDYQTLNLLFRCNKEFSHEKIRLQELSDTECMIPALIAMMMVMVYNLADTFFLGLTHNDLLVTAVSFATPLFMIFMSLGTLFTVNYNPEITNTHVIRYNGVLYDITRVDTFEGYKEDITLCCCRRARQ